MPPDEDPHLKEAFAEIHRETCEQAPPFGAMRERALRVGERAPRSHRAPPAGMRLAAVAAVVIGAALAWRFAQGPDSPAPVAVATAVPPRVEQLLDAIEEHLELTDALDSPSYPTDLLITQLNIDPIP